MMIKKIFIFALALEFLLSASLSFGDEDQASRLVSAFSANTGSADAERGTRNVLESLELSSTQKSEIQSILLAAVQSMDAVSSQLQKLESDPERLLSEDVHEMKEALRKQRVQLAEMLSVEILSVLSPQQRSQLKLMPDNEPGVSPVQDQILEKVSREFET